MALARYIQLGPIKAPDISEMLENNYKGTLSKEGQAYQNIPLLISMEMYKCSLVLL